MGAIDITFRKPGLSIKKIPIGYRKDILKELKKARKNLTSSIRGLSRLHNFRIMIQAALDKEQIVLDHEINAIYFYNQEIQRILRKGILLKEEQSQSDFDSILSVRNCQRIESFFIGFDIPQKLWTNEIWKEKISQLFDGLTLKVYGADIECKFPEFSRKEAFELIWYLQEGLEIIPKNEDIELELCNECETEYFSCESGFHCSRCGTNFCDDCNDACDECGQCSVCCQCFYAYSEE